MIDRLLIETNATNIPVAEGIPTKAQSNSAKPQWAKGGNVPPKSHPQAVDFLLDQIKKDPGNITLVAIGPLTNIGAAIDRDPATFKKLNRVVIMGGAVRKGYGDLGYTPDHGPQPEYNIYSDVAAAQKLFASGVPIYMMPLDSTQLKLDEDKRAFLFKQGTPLTNALSTLYYQWGQPTPTLFDAMAVAYVLIHRSARPRRSTSPSKKTAAPANPQAHPTPTPASPPTPISFFVSYFHASPSPFLCNAESLK